MPVIEANEKDFDNQIKTNLTFVDFNADWCGPCQILKPVIEELAEDYESDSDVKILSVNIDDSPELAERYSVSGIPCLILFRNGEEIDRSVGVAPKKAFVKLIEKNR
ncbi:thioredoxin [Candidatus Saccharibacteria bacterium]|nr:thioredoxin [Candidatus Saccharibacteria bacterium]